MVRLLAVVLSALLVAPLVLADEAESIAAAQSEALDWLALVDRGGYGEAWEAAAPLMQAAISSEALQRSLNAARAPLGELQSRNLAKASYHTTLPGAPDGEYVVFTFSTSLAHKAAAVETLTAMKGDDGAWRVAGYFVK